MYQDTAEWYWGTAEWDDHLPDNKYVSHNFDRHKESIHNPVHHPLHLQTLFTHVITCTRY